MMHRSPSPTPRRSVSAIGHPVRILGGGESDLVAGAIAGRLDRRLPAPAQRYQRPGRDRDAEVVGVGQRIRTQRTVLSQALIKPVSRGAWPG